MTPALLKAPTNGDWWNTTNSVKNLAKARDTRVFQKKKSENDNNLKKCFLQIFIL